MKTPEHPEGRPTGTVDQVAADPSYQFEQVLSPAAWPGAVEVCVFRHVATGTLWAKPRKHTEGDPWYEVASLVQRAVSSVAARGDRRQAAGAEPGSPGRVEHPRHDRMEEYRDGGYYVTDDLARYLAQGREPEYGRDAYLRLLAEEVLVHRGRQAVPVQADALNAALGLRLSWWPSNRHPLPGHRTPEPDWLCADVPADSTSHFLGRARELRGRLGEVDPAIEVGFVARSATEPGTGRVYTIYTIRVRRPAPTRRRDWHVETRRTAPTREDPAWAAQTPTDEATARIQLRSCAAAGLHALLVHDEQGDEGCPPRRVVVEVEDPRG